MQRSCSIKQEKIGWCRMISENACEGSDITNSMEQSSTWEANSDSACQILQNLKIHYRAHKSLLPDCILNHVEPVHILTTHLSNIHFNIILPFTPKMVSHLQVFRLKFVCISHFSNVHYMPCPSHPPLFDHPNNIQLRVQIMKLITQTSPACCYFLPLRYIFSPQPNYPNLGSSLKVRHKVSHLYKTGQIVALHF
jgi:hypothetical protein